jgi:hypothetical protein
MHITVSECLPLCLQNSLLVQCLPFNLLYNTHMSVSAFLQQDVTLQYTPQMPFSGLALHMSKCTVSVIYQNASFCDYNTGCPHAPFVPRSPPTLFPPTTYIIPSTLVAQHLCTLPYMYNAWPIVQRTYVLPATGKTFLHSSLTYSKHVCMTVCLCLYM